jgi:hypothetical protein
MTLHFSLCLSVPSPDLLSVTKILRTYTEVHRVDTEGLREYKINRNSNSI